MSHYIGIELTLFIWDRTMSIGINIYDASENMNLCSYDCHLIFFDPMFFWFD